jgi:2'-5' RNA ligase
VANEWIRSFVAVDLNNDHILDNILKIQQTLSRTGADIKPVERENIHITLRFLGEVKQERVQEIIEQMKQVQFERFTVDFRGLGVFPGLHRPTVIWIGIEKGAKELSRIFETLEQGLRALSIRPDSKGFTPHLTIARVKSGRNRAELVRTISELQDMEFGSMNVDSVKLKKSTLTPKGPIYTDLYELSTQSASNEAT